MLRYNYREKFINSPFFIYTDKECLLEKIDKWNNNQEKSSKTKVTTHSVVIQYSHTVSLITRKTSMIFMKF